MEGMVDAGGSNAPGGGPTPPNAGLAIEAARVGGGGGTATAAAAAAAEGGGGGPARLAAATAIADKGGIGDTPSEPFVVRQ